MSAASSEVILSELLVDEVGFGLLSMEVLAGDSTVAAFTFALTMNEVFPCEFNRFECLPKHIDEKS